VTSLDITGPHFPPNFDTGTTTNDHEDFIWWNEKGFYFFFPPSRLAFQDEKEIQKIEELEKQKDENENANE
jgi:hypothetical protein